MPNKRWQILQNAYPLTRRAVRRIHSSATKEERAWTATTPSRTEPSSFPSTSIRRHSQFDLQKRQEQTESLSGIMVPRSRAGAVQLPGRKRGRAKQTDTSAAPLIPPHKTRDEIAPTICDHDQCQFEWQQHNCARNHHYPDPHPNRSHYQINHKGRLEDPPSPNPGGLHPHAQVLCR